MQTLLPDEVFGLLHPAVDAHTLGLESVASLLRQAGYQAIVGGRRISEALDDLRNPAHSEELLAWCAAHRITRLGLSCRLDPALAVDLLGRVRHVLVEAGAYGTGREQIRALSFAGLPQACDGVRRAFGSEIAVFSGDESAAITLLHLGVPSERIPASILRTSSYDDDRIRFGEECVSRGRHLAWPRVDRSGYPLYGTAADTLVARVEDAQRRNLPPLIRAHYGPFTQDRAAALEMFYAGVSQIAQAGQVDVLSIATSQLTQDSFGQNWAGRPNGGGVPINSAAEYRRARETAAPMLVRTYAGTNHVDTLAVSHEESLNIAWHALSLWWFSRIDGRGPNSVRENLRQHLTALRFIASTGKPFEPNIPHHFSFRGADDTTYVLSAVLAARVAARHGIRTLVLQIMLNTPKSTSGVQDLAKARATLRLIRAVEPGLRVVLQPRVGLDYLSADHDRAKAQLAAGAALMDDIEPGQGHSPAVIHVVSYSEGTGLATPDIITESAQLTQYALARYRRLRAQKTPAASPDAEEVAGRTQHLVDQVQSLLASIEKHVPDPYSASGLYQILRAGYLAVPHLWEERDEFRHATAWNTSLLDGAVVVTSPHGVPMPIRERVALCEANLVDVPR